MEFCILTKEEFNEYVANHEQASFLQTVEWGNLREIYGSIIHYLGVKKNKKIIAATMISEDNLSFKMKRFYAPRGFIIDYHDIELLRFFTDNLKKYAKKNKAIYIRIDPNVIYQVRNIDGCEKEKPDKNDLAINNLKSLGYIHSGFTKELTSAQSRWNFRLTLDKPYDELIKNFSKSTRKNIESTYNKGVRIRIAKLEDLNSMEDILVKTAERKNFKARSLEYYINMYKTLKDNVRIYIAYLDPDIYLESSKDLLNKEKENNQNILNKMEHDLVGNKLKNQLDTSNKLIEKLENELKLAEQFKSDYPKGLDIGTLISLKSGNEYLTLYSGILMEYKRFTPKYLMYNEHIKDAYNNNFKYIDFYGITGNFNKDDKDYGMYEFKRGFGGEVIEMIGEFTLPVQKKNYLYKVLNRLKRLLRK